MKPSQIAKMLGAELLCPAEGREPDIQNAFSSDLMSDVLKLEADHTLLITGLANLQAIRTAEMADISCIVFARGKKVTDEMVKLAKDNGMTVIRTPFSVYRTSGELYKAGLNPVY
ncbi:MAG: DRTGG domain-containing protein [Bacteroidales bacterium]